jgi:predicted transcriptional regulator
MATQSTTSLKLDGAMRERVRRLAAARRRSPRWVMRKAVGQQVEREEKREQLTRHGRGRRRLAGQARSGRAHRYP